MQEKIQFWTSWKSIEKNTFVSLFLLLCLLTTYTIWAKWHGNANTISWDVVTELNEKIAPADTYSDGSLQFQTTERFYYVKEKYVPTGIQLKNISSWIYVIGLFLGISLLLSALLRQKSIWFMASVILLGGMLLAIRLEIIFNITSNTAFIVPFLLIGGVTYYFNSWSKRNDFFITLPIFLVLFAALLGISIVFSQVPEPIASMAHFGIVVGLVITLIVIFFISHEIIAGIVWVATSSKSKSASSVLTFTLASSIYLLNILLVYLENSNKIEWSVVVIAPLYLFIISLGLGLWGFYRFCEQTELISFRQAGVWLYIGAAIVSSVTLISIYTSANDPLIELTNDFIAIAHLVGGFLFFIHTLLNFYPIFKQNKAVHKVLYKPAFTKLIVARLLTAVGIVLVFAAKSDYSVRQWIAGYANSVGDYHLLTDDLFTAEAYYKQSLKFDERNHKANYSLASIAYSQGDKTTAGFYFKQANLKNPSEYAFLGLSETLLQENLFFDALFVLQEGEKKFPKSSPIFTNLGRIYEKANVVDSAYIYYNKAYQNCTKCEVESSNLLAFWIENARPEKLDSVSLGIASSDGISAKANRVAIYKILHKKEAVKMKIAADSLLSVSEFACLFNLQTNATIEKPAFDDATLRALQLKPENAGYYDALLFARSKQNYLNGDKREAIKQLAYVVADSTKDNRLNAQTLGVWFLQEGVYNKAVEYFGQAKDTLTLNLLQKQNYAENIDAVLFDKSKQLLKTELTTTNYEAVLRKAPYNPYVIENVVELLNKNKQEQKAYQVVYDAIKANDQNARLWQVYTLQALRVGVKEYAIEGLAQLRKLLSAASFDAFLLKYEALKHDRFSQDFY